jgi:protein transport protein SEC61 subunit alpha
MARGSSALDLVRPLASMMPSMRRPNRVVPFHRRALYTGLSASVFLVCSHLPLYGVRYAAATAGADPLYLVRSILASNRGTLMELGVGPVITAATVAQLLAASKLIPIDMNVRADRELLDGARKVLAMVIALGEAAASVLLGMYGPVGAINGALIVLQLVSASTVVVFLDDLFDKGYGLRGSSAVSLFSATNTCGKVFWSAFSPVTVNTGRGPEFEGIVLAVAHQLVARAGRARKLIGAMLRQHLPNTMNLLATCLVLLAAIYLEGIKMLVPLQSRDTRGRRGTFPIKLLYTSTMPIMLYSTAVSALYIVSQMLHYSRLGGSVLARLLGVWKEAGHAAVPVGGLAYYVTAPASLAAAPLHALVYAALLLASCALLSQAWVVASGSSARDITRQLSDQRLVVPGRRDGATYHVLSRCIPTAAALGGLCVGALTIFADMTGVIGTGTGVMLAATAVYNLVKSVEKED